MSQLDVVKIKDNNLFYYGKVTGETHSGMLKIKLFPNEANLKQILRKSTNVEFVNISPERNFAIDMVAKAYYKVNLHYAELGSSQTDMVHQALRTAMETTIKEIIEGK